MSVVPSDKAREVAAMLKAVHAQEDRASAEQKATAVVAKLEDMKLSKAAATVRDGVAETLSYMSFPREHWPRRQLGVDAGDGAAAARGRHPLGHAAHMHMKRLKESAETNQETDHATRANVPPGVSPSPAARASHRASRSFTGEALIECAQLDGHFLKLALSRDRQKACSRAGRAMAARFGTWRRDHTPSRSHYSASEACAPVLPIHLRPLVSKKRSMKLTLLIGHVRTASKPFQGDWRI